MNQRASNSLPPSLSLSTHWTASAATLAILVLGLSCVSAQTAAKIVSGKESSLRCKVRVASPSGRTLLHIQVRNRGQHHAEPMAFAVAYEDGEMRIVPRVPMPWTMRRGRAVAPGKTRNYYLNVSPYKLAKTPTARVEHALFYDRSPDRRRTSPVTVKKLGKREVKKNGRLVSRSIFQLKNTLSDAVDIWILNKSGGSHANAQRLRIPASSTLEHDGGPAIFHQGVEAMVHEVEVVDWSALVSTPLGRGEELLAEFASERAFKPRLLDLPTTGDSVRIVTGRRQTFERHLAVDESKYFLMDPKTEKRSQVRDLGDTFRFLQFPPWERAGTRVATSVLLENGRAIYLHVPGTSIPLIFNTANDIPVLELRPGKSPRLHRHVPFSAEKLNGLPQSLVWKRPSPTPGNPPRLLELWTTYEHSPNDPVLSRTMQLHWKKEGDRSRLLRAEIDYPNDDQPPFRWTFAKAKAGTNHPGPGARDKSEAPRSDPAATSLLEEAWERVYRYPGQPRTLRANLELTTKRPTADWGNRAEVRARITIQDWTGLRTKERRERHGELKVALLGSIKETVEGQYKSVIGDRLSIMGRQVPAGWPSFDEAFGEAVLKQGKSGWITASRGPIAAVRIKRGTIHSLRRRMGAIETFKWSRVDGERVATRVSSTHGKLEPVLDLEWRRIDGVLMPVAWRIEGWFHRDFEPESFTLEEVSLKEK